MMLSDTTVKSLFARQVEHSLDILRSDQILEPTLFLHKKCLNLTIISISLITVNKLLKFFRVTEHIWLTTRRLNRSGEWCNYLIRALLLLISSEHHHAGAALSILLVIVVLVLLTVLRIMSDSLMVHFTIGQGVYVASSSLRHQSVWTVLV